MAGGEGGENIEIREKQVVYHDLLKELLKKCKVAKCRLDTYHHTLSKVNTFIQLTVIYLSASSTFLQALIPEGSEDQITSSPTDNLTDVMVNIADVVKNGESVEWLGFTTLFITSYSSLIIAAARHLKIEERVGNMSNLIDRFAELISRIHFDIDTLKPWAEENYYKEMDDEETKKRDWNTVESNIKKEYDHILDIKKELFTSYRKIIRTDVYRKYQIIFDAFHNNYIDDDDDDKIGLEDDIFCNSCCDRCLGKGKGKGGKKGKEGKEGKKGKEGKEGKKGKEGKGGDGKGGDGKGGDVESGVSESVKDVNEEDDQLLKKPQGTKKMVVKS